MPTGSASTDARSFGNQSIFKGPVGNRVQGLLTVAGTISFEVARRKLAKMSGRETASDRDTIIALSIGWRETERYLFDKEQEERKAK